MFNRISRGYTLTILTAVYTLNLVDRGLMSLLLQPIKEDLRLSDTQLGFLTGIAFGLFYATLGLPIARWADRGNRATITSLAIGLWGLTVMASLFVGNFMQMAAARVAAAVGEAGCKPPAYSLLGDYFTRSAERTFAMAVFFAGSPLAALTSFIIGGWLNELYGWRMTFLVMGVPGLLLALLVKATIADPRTAAAKTAVRTEPLPSFREVLSVLWEHRSLRHMSAGIILLYTMTLGFAPWYAAFMVRSHDMTTGELGVWFGMIFGGSGLTGILLGGYLASRWFAENARGQMYMSAVAILASLPCLVAFLLLPQKHAALYALVPQTLIFNSFVGPTFALMQRLVGDRMRATMLALVMLLANLIGMGLGPQIVGILSDQLAPTMGNDSLRYAMLLMASTSVWAAWHFWRGGKSVVKDLIASDTSSEGSSSVAPRVLTQTRASD